MLLLSQDAFITAGAMMLHSNEIHRQMVNTRGQRTPFAARLQTQVGDDNVQTPLQIADCSCIALEASIIFLLGAHHT